MPGLKRVSVGVERRLQAKASDIIYVFGLSLFKACPNKSRTTDGREAASSYP